ncbi:pimeloyl-ACP methyl ester carboxylesterase [Aeromicrobium sp. SORGH_AS981]|uniref:alpha/beta fold hydrolase n=1 Tax=Aeromicrobium sp. SORGH_AS_0981 TaxID=3041802 RepID=UPI002855A11C|nr:alpha/beta hydrolase [Aeromicrobium sp. SORGH_AS_0981]MDR6116907.1 pimeloyl-ACP methyl ester carboxylesterase [Aeromicrobium sp. SORGH_AS_0981]
MAGSGEQFAHLPSGIDLCYETFGDPTDPPVLLVMGLGGPMGWWDVAFCEQLVARGLFVVRYDNRDTGRSTKLRQHRVSRIDLAKALVGLTTPPYTIGDLADDAFGLLDHLEIDAAHVVGVSMGGMIAQTMAVAHPERVRSLVSIMSTTGRRTVGYQNPKLLPALLSKAGHTRDEYVERSLRGTQMIASPDYPTDPEFARDRAYETYDRGWSAGGVTRQVMAILTQPDRTADLARLDVPATVIHGTRDPLVHRSGGKATAAALRGSEHVEIEGMAHDLPSQLYDQIVEAIVRTVERAQHA